MATLIGAAPTCPTALVNRPLEARTARPSRTPETGPASTEPVSRWPQRTGGMTPSRGRSRRRVSSQPAATPASSGRTRTTLAIPVSELSGMAANAGSAGSRMSSSPTKDARTTPAGPKLKPGPSR